jgi:hypothetical protein
MMKAKAESSVGIGDVIDEIEQKAKHETVGERIAAFEARTPKSQRGDPAAALIKQAEVRAVSESLHEKARTAEGGADGGFLKLSPRTIGEFFPLLLSLNLHPALLGSLNAEQTQRARAALRVGPGIEERRAAMKVFVLAVKQEIDSAA